MCVGVCFIVVGLLDMVTCTVLLLILVDAVFTSQTMTDGPGIYY